MTVIDLLFTIYTYGFIVTAVLATICASFGWVEWNIKAWELIAIMGTFPFVLCVGLAWPYSVYRLFRDLLRKA